MTTTGHGGARPGAGRKPVDPGRATQAVHIRLTQAQRDELARRGGPQAVRDWLDKPAKK